MSYKINPAERIGLKFTLLNGEVIEVIDYINATNCKILFLSDNTIIEKVQWGNIIRGKIGKINYRSKENNDKKLTTIYQQNCGDKLKILHYHSKYCSIQFLSDNSILYGITFQNIRNGNVFNKNYVGENKLYGFGYIGKGKYNSNNKPYKIWCGILKRCLSEKFKIEHKTYVNSVICDEWLNFQVFAEWYYINEPKNCNKLNLTVDKDILFQGNKKYGPDLCCIVPEDINNLFIKPINSELPTGVKYAPTKNKYKAQISKYSINYHLGTFDSIQEAFETYKKEKKSYILEVANKYKHILPDNVYLAIINYNIS